MSNYDLYPRLSGTSAGNVADVWGVITDPGSGAIPVRQSGTCCIATTGATTRTLAVPTFIGQEITLYLDTDGGDCVVTVAQAINATGNNTITLNDVRDNITLKGVTVASALRWEVLVNNGCTLSTV